MVYTKLRVFDGSNRVLLFPAFGNQMFFSGHQFTDMATEPPPKHSKDGNISMGREHLPFKSMYDVSLEKHYQVKSYFPFFEE